MGERDWGMRYKDARQQADYAARDLKEGREVKGWHYEPTWLPGQPEPPKMHLEGPAWVAWLYQIALENAQTLVQVHGAHNQHYVDECKQLMEDYQQQARKKVQS